MLHVFIEVTDRSVIEDADLLLLLEHGLFEEFLALGIGQLVELKSAVGFLDDGFNDLIYGHLKLF